MIIVCSGNDDICWLATKDDLYGLSNNGQVERQLGVAV